MPVVTVFFDREIVTSIKDIKKVSLSINGWNGYYGLVLFYVFV
jgi:hypothetical protein